MTNTVTLPSTRACQPPIEAGAFELQGLSGVSLACGSDVLGIRLACPHPALGLVDEKDVLLTMDGPEAFATDQSYTKVRWHVPITPAGVRRLGGWPRRSINAPLVYDFASGEAAAITLEWRRDGDTVVGHYTADGPVRVGLFVNGCFAPATVIAAAPAHCRLELGDSALELVLVGPVEAPLLVDSRLQAEQAWAGTILAAGTAMALYPVALSPDRPLHFVMRLKPRTAATGAAQLLDAAAIDQRLANGAREYAASRMRSTGAFAGAAEALGGLTGYSRTYDPKRQMLQTTVNRTWGLPNQPGLIYGWDNFFDSYIAAWEDPRLGAASLEHIVATYGAKGIAHGPIQRNLIIPVIYCRTLEILNDEALARRTWPVMMEFMRFWFADRGDGRPWRDGNGDGLIEAGVSGDPAAVAPGTLIQDAMDETGYDEIPIYSAGFTDGRLGMLADGVEFDWPSRTLTVTLLCQNCLYIASARIMARWADRLGHVADAAWLRGEAERVATRVRERLYCAKDGIFRDRFWNGDFSPVKAMTIFYPLLAGIADDAIKAKLRETLLDPKQFWGENLIPTVSRDDPAYRDGLDGNGNYWRGNCWPPTTYMVYLSIKEAGWDDLAAEYARRVCGQFMEYWRTHGHAYENYPAEGKVDHRFLYVQMWGGRELRYVWAGMLPLCALEELFAPEVTRAGVRFGNPHLQEQAVWRNFTWQGKPVEAEAGPQRTRVHMGEEWRFLAEPGIVVRGFTTDDGIAFSAVTREPSRVRLEASGFEPSATISVLVNGRPIPCTIEGGAVGFVLSAGKADVRIARETCPCRIPNANMIPHAAVKSHSNTRSQEKLPS